MAAPRKTSPKKRSTPSLESFETLVMNAGMKPGPFLHMLKFDLRKTPDPLRAANNLHRFLSSGFSTILLRDFQQHPVLQRVALTLFSQSQYLADILVRDPELFRWLTASAALRVTKSKSDLMEEAVASVSLFARFERKLDALKRFYRREILRIGARDILQEADVVMVTQELTHLADVVIEVVVQLGQQDLAARTGARFRSTLAVIGLGKLGGQELNFSSDIDLLFVYEKDGDFDAPQERIRTYHEYYNRLAEFIVRTLGEHTGEGFLYRVDMRLRPEGSAGSLAISRAASLQYYEVRGETWERQMLVKARPVAGNQETGTAWLNDLRPFVYPRTFLRSPLEELAAMKSRIESRVDTKSNIKLGEGGIRDIEFVTQGLQLLNGGELDVVREPNTLNGLEALAEIRKLPRNDVVLLSRAYKFFRTVEHRLQLLHGVQTHSLPPVRAEEELLARRLGFPSGKLFRKTLETHRRAVRSIFKKILKAPPKGALAPKRTRRAVLRVLDEKTSMQLLGTLATEFPILAEPGHSHELAQCLRESGAPDWALGSLTILANSGPIRRALGQAWKNRELMRLLVQLGARSRAHALLLAREPLLFETLVGQPGEVFSNVPRWGFLRDHEIAKFETYNEYGIVIPFLAGTSDLSSVMHRLSDFAEEMLLKVGSTHAAFGDTCLVALGKLGGKEITLGSDLDLLLVYKADRLDPPLAEEVAKFLHDYYRRHGLREIDFRLRPEGKNSPLAVELQYYREYLTTRASLWEQQTLLKARVISGPGELQEEIRNLFAETVTSFRVENGWVEEVLAMRNRIAEERSMGGENLKTGVGGLVDLEFALQALQLRFGKSRERLRHQNSLEVILGSERERLLSRQEAATMRNNLLFLRNLETMVRLNTDARDFILPNDIPRLQALAAATGVSSHLALLKKVESVKNQNRRIFLSVMERCGS